MSVQHLRTLTLNTVQMVRHFARHCKTTLKQSQKTESNSDLQECFDIRKAEGVGHSLQNVLSVIVASCCLGCQHRLYQKLKIQNLRLLYYLIREIKTWLNINHITEHNNTYFIL